MPCYCLLDFIAGRYGISIFLKVLVTLFVKKRISYIILSKSGKHYNSYVLCQVDILTRVHHRNLVSFIGYCDEGERLILVYEYQANGTLREWLHGKQNTNSALSS